MDIFHLFPNTSTIKVKEFPDNEATERYHSQVNSVAGKSMLQVRGMMDDIDLICIPQQFTEN